MLQAKCAHVLEFRLQEKLMQQATNQHARSVLMQLSGAEKWKGFSHALAENWIRMIRAEGERERKYSGVVLTFTMLGKKGLTNAATAIENVDLEPVLAVALKWALLVGADLLAATVVMFAFVDVCFGRKLGYYNICNLLNFFLNF